MVLMRTNHAKLSMSMLSEQDELVLLRALVRASNTGVLLSDSSRKDLICNDAFCRMFSIEGIEPLGMGEGYLRSELLPRIKNGEEFLRSIEDAYSDPLGSFEDEIEIIAPRHRYIRRFTTPVTGDDGELIGRLWTFLDITRLRRLEDRVAVQAAQLKEQTRRLAIDLRSVSGRLVQVETELTQTQRHLLESERMSAAGLLGASVAHNIRNILTPLRIELSLARAGSDAHQAESFMVMESQLERLSLLTHRLLAIARPAESEPVEVDVCELVIHAAQMLSSQARQESVVIETSCSRRTPVIYGDPVQLEQLVVNLMLNGIQAMHATEGGALKLTVRPSREGACIQVSDSGVGIPLTSRKRLFDPFFTTRPDGTGLGLYSCRRIAEEHNGRISLRSVIGAGTRVTVWLPAGEKTNAGKDSGS